MAHTPIYKDDKHYICHQAAAAAAPPNIMSIIGEGDIDDAQLESIMDKLIEFINSTKGDDKQRIRCIRRVMDRIENEVESKVELKKRMTELPSVLATWNVHLLTHTSGKSWEMILREVLSYHVDMVAFQEIPMPSKGNRSPRTYNTDPQRLEAVFNMYIGDVVNDESRPWDCVVSNRLGKSFQKMESHAIFFSSKKYRSLERYEGFNDVNYGNLAMKDNTFVRLPFTVFFSVHETDIIFSVTSFHIKESSRREDVPKRLDELKSMAQGMKLLNEFQKYQNVKYHIFLGDFNTEPDEMQKILDEHNKNIGFGKFKILIPQTPTITSDVVDYFIVFWDDAKERLDVHATEVQVEWPVYFNNNKLMSDHRPVVFEFGVRDMNTTEDNGNLVFISSNSEKINGLCKKYQLHDAYHFIEKDAIGDKALTLNKFKKYKDVDDDGETRRDLGELLVYTKDLFVDHGWEDAYEQCIAIFEK